MTEDELWRVIDAATDADESYRDSLAKLQALPDGFALLFAFNYVDAGIANGGISGFYSSTAWPLVIAGVRACELAGANELALILREAVLHYDRKGRSKLKREMPEGFLDGLQDVPDRPVDEIEDAYYSLEEQRGLVWKSLLSNEALWSPA